MISIIVACSENLAIGNKGTMPWHLSGDLKYFKSVTTGKTVIMGRKTYESIGRPLPNRTNIIVSRNTEFVVPEGVILATSLDDATRNAVGDEIIVMGGAQIYRQAWDKADRYYITRVHTTIEEFDASIPPLPENVRLVSSEFHKSDEKNDYDYTFEIYENPSPPSLPSRAEE